MNVRIFWVRAMKCMCAQTRPRFILSSERVFGGMEFEPMSTRREKSPLPENVPRGGSNPRRCGQRAQALPTELFRPRLNMICTECYGYSLAGVRLGRGRPGFDSRFRRGSSSRSSHISGLTLGIRTQACRSRCGRLTTRPKRRYLERERERERERGGGGYLHWIVYARSKQGNYLEFRITMGSCAGCSRQTWHRRCARGGGVGCGGNP